MTRVEANLWCIVGDVTDCPEPFVPHCGTLPPSKNTIEQRNIWMRDAPGNVSQPIIVETYFHLIYSRDNFRKEFNKNYMAQVRVVTGQLSNHVDRLLTISSQLNTLNRDYASHGISFKLMDKPHYTKQAQWAVIIPWGHDPNDKGPKDHPDFKVCACNSRLLGSPTLS